MISLNSYSSPVLNAYSDTNVPELQAMDMLLKSIWEKGNQCRELDQSLRLGMIDVQFAFNERAKATAEKKVKEIVAELEGKKSEIKNDLVSLREVKEKRLIDKQVTENCQGQSKELAFVKDFTLQWDPRPVQCGRDLSNETDPLTLIEAALKDHEGVIIGESHNDAVLDFLLNQSKRFQEMGVDTLFLEGFKYKDQHEIDLYLQGDKEPYIGKLDMPSCLKESYLKELDAAGKAGFRVVGLDDDQDTNGIERLLSMNLTAKEAIQKEKKGKYIAVIGGAHLTCCYGEAVPGVAEITKSPAIEIYRNEKEKTTYQNMMASRYGDLRTRPLGVAVIEKG